MTATVIAATGVAAGIGALAALVVLTSLLPVEAEAGLASAAPLTLGADLEIRSMGLLLVFGVSAALLAWSTRPQAVLAGREPGSQPKSRE